MVSWQTVQSLAIFFGPFLLSRGLGYYRSIRNRPASQIRPLPPKTSYALGVLFVSGVLAFLSTLPLFAPENVFRLTQSRLGTTAGVIMTRLAAVRSLTPFDERLREVFDAGGVEARLLYAQFGPSVLLNSPLAKPGDADAARSYLIYALPSLLTPHILHLFALGIATSALLAGKESASWRTTATLAGLALAAAEVYLVATFDSRANARSTRVNDIDFLYWKLQVYHGIGIAALDSVLGWAIYLQATGRAFVAPRTPSERVLDHALGMEKVLAKVRSLGVIRNGTVREADLRRRVDDYWVKEGEVMRSVLEEPEVLEAQRNALRRLDSVRVGHDAEGFVDGILGTGPVPAGSPGLVMQ